MTSAPVLPARPATQRGTHAPRLSLVDRATQAKPHGEKATTPHLLPRHQLTTVTTEEAVNTHDTSSQNRRNKETMVLRTPKRAASSATTLPPLPEAWPNSRSSLASQAPSTLPSHSTSDISRRTSSHTREPDTHINEWDRCRLSASYPRTVQWLDTSSSLDVPLPLDAPEVESTARILGAACLDVLLGHRAISSLRPWLTEEILGVLKRRASLGMRIKGRAPAHQHGEVRKTFVSKVHERAYEVSLVSHDGERYRAMAMRMEFWNGRWRLMALDIG